MKEITLTQGYVAQVSDKDYAWVSKYKWFADVTYKPDGSISAVYAARSSRSEGKQYMHRVLLGVTSRKVKVDHKDHKGLNNQRRNLRVSTHQQNISNQVMHKNNTSGVKGVHWRKDIKKWAAQIMVNYKCNSLGCYTSKVEAKDAYDAAASKFFKQFSNNNKDIAASAA